MSGKYSSYIKNIFAKEKNKQWKYFFEKYIFAAEALQFLQEARPDDTQTNIKDAIAFYDSYFRLQLLKIVGIENIDLVLKKENICTKWLWCNHLNKNILQAAELLKNSPHLDLAPQFVYNFQVKALKAIGPENALCSLKIKSCHQFDLIEKNGIKETCAKLLGAEAEYEEF